MAVVRGVHGSRQGVGDAATEGVGVGADWLTVAESADESGRSLVQIVDALIAGALPYLRSGDDPLRWYIAHDQLQFWLARRRLD